MFRNIIPILMVSETAVLTGLKVIFRAIQEKKNRVYIYYCIGDKYNFTKVLCIYMENGSLFPLDS